jgi:homoserine kinase type II
MRWLTGLELGEARRMAAGFGLDVERLQPVHGGRVNSNYRLRTVSKRSYFLRIYEQLSEAQVLTELRLVAELARQGVPTPPAHRRTDAPGWLHSHRGKPVALFPWVPGHWLCQATVTPEVCAAVGRELARLHQTTACVPSPPDRLGIDRLRQALDVVAASTHADRAAAVTLRRRLDDYAALRDPQLPRGIIHGDLFRENVLWHEHRIAALVDFEYVSEGPLVYDLMVCALAWCFGSTFELPLLRALVEGYATERPLTTCELRALGTEAAIGCLRFATTRLRDFSLNASRGEAPVRDYRRFLARLDALEDGVGAWLTDLATDIARSDRRVRAEKGERI